MSPKLTRKYPSEKKTTTAEGKREYQKLQMREVRERQKAQEQAKDARLSELEQLFQKQTEEQTKQIEDAFKPHSPPVPDEKDQRITDLEAELADVYDRLMHATLELLYLRATPPSETILVRQKDHE